MVRFEIINESNIKEKKEVKLFTEEDAIKEAEKKKCIVAFY